MLVFDDGLQKRVCEFFQSSTNIILRFRIEVSYIQETSIILRLRVKMGSTLKFGFTQDEPLYDPTVLKMLNFAPVLHMFSPPISAANPGDSLLVRPLCRCDYDRGYMQLLKQLTEVGHVSREQFSKRFTSMKSCPNTYYITVVEDTTLNEVIAAASLIIEQKFIHDCAVRGRLEDVVVNNTYRGKQLGKLIVMTVTLLAKELGCYKMTLDCKDKLIPFYRTLGYVDEPGNANSMTVRFDSRKTDMNSKL